MKVSVIVAVHNAEKELFRCVSSLVEQTLEDMEILLVDDASTDGSREQMEDYRSQFPELIRCIYLDERVYPGGARNRGIEEARGEYIAFVDTCDRVEPGMCEDLYYAAKGTDMCGADYWTERSDVRKEVYPNYGPGLEMNEKKKVTFLNGCGSYATRIYSRRFLNANALRFPEGTYYEDIHFVFMTALHAEDAVKTDGRYYCLSRGEDMVPLQERWQRLEIPGKILSECRERGIYEQYKDLIDYKYIAMQMGNIRYHCMKSAMIHHKDKLAQIVKDIRERCPDFAVCSYYKQIPWHLRAYLRLTMASPTLAVICRYFDWAINLCSTIHDMLIK